MIDGKGNCFSKDKKTDQKIRSQKQHNMQSLKAAWKATTQCNWSNKKTRSGQPEGTVAAAGEWENDEQGTVLDNC